MGTAHSSFPPPSNSVPAPFLKKKKAPPLHKSRRGIAIIDPFPRTWSDLHAACDAATDAATLLGDDGGHPPVPEPLPAPAPSNDDAAPAPPEKKNSDDDYVAVTWERGGHYDHFVPIVRRDALLGGVAAGRRGLRRGTSSAGFVRMPRMDRVNFPITRRVRTEEKICVLARKKRRPRPPDDEVSGDAADRYDVLTLAEFSTIHRLLGALREVLLVGSRPVHDIPPRPVVAVASSSRSFDTEDGEDDVPTALWRRQRRQREEDAQYDEECQICMDHPVNVVFPCGHTCCQKCMRQWLGESGHCFMCRREVMGNSKQGNLWKSGEPEDECWQVIMQHLFCHTWDNNTIIIQLETRTEEDVAHEVHDIEARLSLCVLECATKSAARKKQYGEQLFMDMEDLAAEDLSDGARGLTEKLLKDIFFAMST